MKNKKAQLTIFVIIGIIIVIALVTLYLIKSQKTSQIMQTEIPGEVQYAGQQELRTFMDACIKEAAYNAIEITRLQAGYIDIPQDVPTVLVKDSKNEQIVEENGIKKVIISPNGNGNNIPYWLDSDNNLHVPTKEYVAESLASYIGKSVSACAGNFDSFRNQGYTINAGDIVTTVELSDIILIRIEFPLVFEKKDIKFEEKEFIFKLPININKALDLQNEIVVGESLNYYLESNIKNILSLYSYAGGNKADYDLPSLTFADANTNCNMVTWTLDEVRQKLITNLNSNLRFFGIKGITKEENDGSYKGFIQDVLLNQYNNSNVSFRLAGDDFYLDIKPRSGSAIKPNRHRATGIKFLPLFCNVRYQFKYTLKFPLLSDISLLDSPAVDINGKTIDKDNKFSFEVPIGVFLCGNQNRVCTGKPAYAENEPVIDYEKIGIEQPTETMFCDEEMKISQPMKIRVLDAYSFAPVKDASLFYRCGDLENECLIANSDSSGVIEAKFPLCENGNMYIIKEEYSQTNKLLSTYPGNELKQIDYLAEPLKKLEVEVKLIDLPNFIGNYYISNGFTSSRCDGKKVIADDSSLAATAVFDENIAITSLTGPSQIAFVYPENKELKLSSGRYSFTYLAESEVSIQPSTYEAEGKQQTLSYNKNGGSYKGSYLIGSYNNFRASFDLEGIKAAKKIIFYVPVETTLKNFELKDIAPIIQPDGSLYKSGMIDDDCNPSTPAKEVAVNISKEDVEVLLRPRLE